MPPSQVGVAFAGIGHIVHELPQCIGSERTSVQLPLQSMFGQVQLLMHW